MEKINLHCDISPHPGHLPKPTTTVCDRIEIQLRIPDQYMAKQIMEKTIALLHQTAKETKDPNEKAQALECINLIRRDNREYFFFLTYFLANNHTIYNQVIILDYCIQK